MEGWVGDLIQLFVAGLMFLTFLQSRSNSKKIDDVHIATNSMKDELVKATAASSFAAGEKQERDRPK